ncbi:MAG: hypothetical protein JNK52_04835, partial [Zoogloeaceae bacterium]|nr:hypothetical protein [Zoogloeaceae bacterium]
MPMPRLYALVSLPGLILAATLAHATGDNAERDRIAAAVQATRTFDRAERFELNPAGAASSHKLINTSSFSQPSANMSFERQLDFKVGDGIFRKLWVSSPSSTESSNGLGPLFNARSCQSCHLKDGRGSPPLGDEAAVSMFLRLSIP